MNISKSNATSIQVSVCSICYITCKKLWRCGNYVWQSKNVHTDDPTWQHTSVASTSEAGRQVRKKIQYRDSTYKTLKLLRADKVECRRLELLTLGGGSIAVAHPSAALCIDFSKSSRNSSKSLTLRCSQVPQDNVPACLPSVGVTASLKRGWMDESSKPPTCWLISRARLFMAPWTNNLSI